MTRIQIADPVLMRSRLALGEADVSKLERLVVFGSRTRGDALPDSDYGIAVFIHNPESFGDGSGRRAEIETDILCDTGAVINSLPIRADTVDQRTGLMSELRPDGTDLSSRKPNIIC